MGCFSRLERQNLYAEWCQYYTGFAAWRITDSVTHACLNFPYILMEHF